MDLQAGALPGDKPMLDGRIARRVEETLLSSLRLVYQNGISDSQKDGRNWGRFLYSDRRSTAEKGAVRCQRRRWREGRGCSCNRAKGRRPRGWWGKDGEGKAIQTLETSNYGNRG